MFSAPVTVMWTVKARDVAIAEQDDWAGIKVAAVAVWRNGFSGFCSILAKIV